MKLASSILEFAQTAINSTMMVPSPFVVRQPSQTSSLRTFFTQSQSRFVKGTLHMTYRDHAPLTSRELSI